MTRRQAVLALVLAAVAVLASTAPVWLSGTTSSALDTEVVLAATGGRAAPGVTAGGIVVLAAALALALGRRVGAVVAAVVAGLAGVLVAVAAAGAPVRGEAVLAGLAADQVGVGEVSAVSVSAWPWVATAAGALVVVLAGVVLVASRRWHGPSTRHEAPTRDPVTGPGSDDGSVWDALTRGEDPT